MAKIVTGEQAAKLPGDCLIVEASDGVPRAGSTVRHVAEMHLDLYPRVLFVVVDAPPSVFADEDQPAPGMTVDGDVLADVIGEAVPRYLSNEVAHEIAEEALRLAVVTGGMTVLRGPGSQPWTPPEQPLRTGQRITTRAELERVGPGGVVKADGEAADDDVPAVNVRDVDGTWTLAGGGDGYENDALYLPVVVLDPGRSADSAPAVGELASLGDVLFGSEIAARCGQSEMLVRCNDVGTPLLNAQVVSVRDARRQKDVRYVVVGYLGQATS